MAEPSTHVLLERRVTSASPEATEALAAALACRLEPGTVLALHGELGAGKTCFVRGAARGLGVTDEVTSPTYTLMHAYEGRLPVYHLDAWMQGRGEAFLDDGGAEWLHEDGIALVEWAERVVGWLPLPRLEVELRHVAPQVRSIVLRVLGPVGPPPRRTGRAPGRGAGGARAARGGAERVSAPCARAPAAPPPPHGLPRSGEPPPRACVGGAG